MLSLMAPLMRTNVRAELPDELHLIDASLYKGSICSASLPDPIAERLHYWGDVRSKHTYLHSQAIAPGNKNIEARGMHLN